MLIRQESVTEKMALKDLPSASPLPNASLVLVFGSVKRFNDSKLPAFLKARYPAAQIVGCTTTGEIGGNKVHDDTLQMTAIFWEKTAQRSTHVKVNGMQQSFEAGEQLARQLKTDDLKAVVVFSDGLNVNGSELLKGFQSVLGDTPIVGGMAGDNATFTKTMLLFNNIVSDNLVIAIGLYGNHLVAVSGALGGWKPYGPPRKITRSVKNVIYELDGKPALPMYKMYIGEHFAKGLPATGLKFPVAVIGESKEVETVRTLAAIDPANNSLTFFGDVPEGETIRLCQTNHDRLVEGAAGAASMVKNHLSEANMHGQGLAICVSCVGRKLVMADQISDEVQAVHASLGPQTVLTGFYSNGEFCPRTNSTENLLHNQTMTIGYLTEDLYS
jgi:hypothetical protein